MRAAGKIRAVRAGLREPAGWYPRGRAGCGPAYGKIFEAGRGGPNDIVAGRVRAQLF